MASKFFDADRRGLRYRLYPMYIHTKPTKSDPLNFDYDLSVADTE